MSIDLAKAFLKEISADEALKRKLLDLSTAAERMQLAAERGFDFTPEEFRDARAELYEDELDTIAGGGICCSNSCENETPCELY
ncbi:MAG: Nif11-like leader peptide family natural product precursor [Chlorobiaceae bacterium]|nr:Nif11-like leader peptide family natural product precursor [Chlorobiaceae bacterium]